MSERLRVCVSMGVQVLRECVCVCIVGVSKRVLSVGILRFPLSLFPVLGEFFRALARVCIVELNRSDEEKKITDIARNKVTDPRL